MKTFSLKTLIMVLILAANIFAQRFSAEPPDKFHSGGSVMGSDYGFIAITQSVALGEKNSSYANLMLFKATEYGNVFKILDSYNKEYGEIQATFATAKYDDLGAIAVLDSFADNKKTAIVAFAYNSKIIISAISLTPTNSITSKTLKEIEITENTSDSQSIRMALIGIEETNNDKTYHIALGNPLYDNGIYTDAGRVSFYSISKNQWTLTQPNTTGIPFLGANVKFGNDLVAINDLDGNGYNELAIVAPQSTQFPNGAVYIYFMDNNYTPSLTKFSVLTGESMPWIDDKNKDRSQNCSYISFANWNNEPHLLLNCISNLNGNASMYYIKDIVLDANGNIANTNTFSSFEFINSYSARTEIYSNIVPIKNHKNKNYALVQPTYISTTAGSQGYTYTHQIQDIDASKNFSIEVGIETSLINVDSLFYKSGTTGFSAKTISGAAQCNVNEANELLCEAQEDISGSWSAIELSSKSACSLYKICKRKRICRDYF
jgi:hypothetical protein